MNDEMETQEEREARQAIEKRERLLKAIMFRNSFKNVMDTRDGRTLIWWLMAECNVFSSIVNEHSGMMYTLAGKRDIGLMLLDKIQNICPEMYMVMVKENQTPTEEEDQ